jgi:hypothetical protein
MESTKPYQDGMNKPKSPDFELLKKLSALGVAIKPSLLKQLKRISVFLSLFFVTHALNAQVELKRFEATFTGTKIKLSWQTAAENNSNYFLVERSSDGKTFETIGMVKATGNPQAQTGYSFYDKDYFNNVLYYQLKSNENGKEKTLAAIVTVQISEEIKETVVYPLSFIPTRVYVDVSKINRDKVVVDVTDADGQKLASTQLDKSQNENAVELKSGYLLQKGNYTMTAFYDNHVIKNKLVVKDPPTNVTEEAPKDKTRLFTLK